MLCRYSPELFIILSIVVLRLSRPQIFKRDDAVGINQNLLFNKRTFETTYRKFVPVKIQTSNNQEIIYYILNNFIDFFETGILFRRNSI